MATGTRVEYNTDGSRKEYFLNGTTISFNSNDDQRVEIPLENNLDYKIILDASPNIHEIHYTNTDIVKTVDISNPLSQTGYYTSPTFTDI